MEYKSAFICNNNEITTGFKSSLPVLDFVRKDQKLTGTKEGCREGDCGACTVLVGTLINGKVHYNSVNSCLLPAGYLQGKHLVTIEGINQNELTYLQHSFVDEGGTQCGFCTPGFILSLTAYLLNADTLNYDEAVDYVGGNLCRCTGHVSIIRAIKKVVDHVSSKIKNNKPDLLSLVELKIIPEYFLSIPQRLELLHLTNDSHNSNDKNLFVVSGGTDLYVQKQDELYSGNVSLLQKTKTEEKIYVKENKCYVDALASVTDIMDSSIIKEVIPDIREYLILFGSRQIRNKATLGGNIINASPIGDLTNIFLSLDATLQLSKKDIIREIPLKEFFIDYKKLNKTDDEILTSVSFNILPKSSLFNYEKVSKRKYLDIASVNTSILIRTESDIIKDVHLSAGGVAPIPLYLKKTVEFLTSNFISSDLLKEAAIIIDKEISPISDVRGSEVYKRLLLRQLFYSHFIKLFPLLIKPEDLL